MYIIIGLGNPGSKYEKTRHNVGFMALDKLAEKHNIKIDKQKFKAEIGEGIIGEERVILVRPLTYMNLSGESVIKVLNFYKETAANIVVIYDDISLDVGKLRIKEKGSAGGHNGMKSIIANIGTQEFTRVRIGVGSKPDGWDLADYVLGQFDKEDIDDINNATKGASEAVEMIVKEGKNKAMNRYN